MRIDHVIYVVDDLEAAGARFLEEFGLASIAGGRHPGWGTANRIVPLGDEYVELVTVVERQEATTSEFGRAVTQALATGRRLLGWAVATDDIRALASRLKLEVTRGSRARPDGSTLGWQLAGAAQALSTGALPFFLQWDGPREVHPGAAAAEHRVRPEGIAWIEITGEEQALHAWLGDHELPLRITDGPPSLSAFAIRTDESELVLR